MVIVTFVFSVNIVFNANSNAVFSLLSSEQSEPKIYCSLNVFDQIFKHYYGRGLLTFQLNDVVFCRNQFSLYIHQLYLRTSIWLALFRVKIERSLMWCLSLGDLQHFPGTSAWF